MIQSILENLWKDGYKINMLQNNDKIYVVCPYYYKTGGTELAHQLVHMICKLGGKAEITYFGDKNAKRVINPAFLEYVEDFVDISQVEDREDNIIVLPEIRPDLADGLKKVQKYVWWMSVDNFLEWDNPWIYSKQHGLIKTVWGILKGYIRIKKYEFSSDVKHLYQSEYAHQFLLQKGMTNCYRLSDYINKVYLDDGFKGSTADRKNQVLYNPKKGYEFTQKIIQATPNVKWIPIQNMSTEDVRRLMNESKLYVDFGNHPGKDRFPREAAISGCCIITGRRGSANYYEDIPISDLYKFEDKDENISVIATQIRRCLGEYETAIDDFHEYCDFIKSEYALFENDVKEIFIGEK